MLSDWVVRLISAPTRCRKSMPRMPGLQRFIGLTTKVCTKIKLVFPSLISNVTSCSPNIFNYVPVIPLAFISHGCVCALLNPGCIKDTMAPVSTMNKYPSPSISTVSTGSVTKPLATDSAAQPSELGSISGWTTGSVSSSLSRLNLYLALGDNFYVYVCHSSRQL